MISPQDLPNTHKPPPSGPYMGRHGGLGGSLSPALDDALLNEQLGALNMSGHGKFQLGMKVRQI